MLQCDVCGVAGLVENRKRICLFDMPNHYIVCPDSGPVRTEQTFTPSITGTKLLSAEGRVADYLTDVLSLCTLVNPPFSSDRQHSSYDVCLEVRGGIIRTVLCCIVH